MAQDSYAINGGDGGSGPGLVTGGGSTNSAVVGGTLFFMPLQDILLSVSYGGEGTLTVVLLHDLVLPVSFSGEGDLSVDLTAVDPSVARVTQFYTEVLRSELNVEDIVDTARVTQFYVEILRSNKGTPRAKNRRKRAIIASGVEDLP